MSKILGVVFLAILAGLVVLGIGGCQAYNGLVTSRQQVDRQWAQVETTYQRRADLIPNLVSTVSGNAQFERTTLKEITDARASVGQLKLGPGQAPESPAAMQQFQAAQDSLGSALSRLLVVVEKYPDLKASQGFRDLQVQLEGTENRITVERQRFNETVQSYNTRVQRFPTALFARLFGFAVRPYFSATAGAEKAPKVEFNFNTPAK
ncbi:MAG TPA: LemA family protein [Verrucomicrobiota bacterium]|nr:LemA family protein [Verrucomicrobiales bacterium]HRI16330.1 LemA family protein [Verrucomicrobiota bacterium]